VPGIESTVNGIIEAAEEDAKGSLGRDRNAFPTAAKNYPDIAITIQI
jgi:hypothetical protein